MPIQHLVPHASGDVDPLAALAAESRPAPAGRPWLLANMVTTLDGATAIGGVSKPLGGPADKAVFSAIRSVADAILVGASTVIEERYRPPQPSDRVVASRQAQGRADRLVIAVVTSSLSLQPDLPLFDDSSYRPLILTVATAPREQRAALESVAEIVNVKADADGRVDLLSALVELHRRGHRQVLSEGGPSLNGQLAAADLIDEWNLTLSPILASGDSARPAHGPAVADPQKMTLTRLWQGDGLLFGRWVRSADAGLAD